MIQKRRTRLVTWLGLALMVMGVSFGHAARAARIEIAAVVGEEVITTTDVAERRDLIMATAGIPLTVENQAKITPRIVQSLVDETLQLQEAKRSSITISDDELAKAIDGMQTRTGKPEPMREFVKKSGLSIRSLESQMRAQLAWNKLAQRKLRRNVSVTQDEVSRAQRAAAASPGEEEVRLQALEFKLPEQGKNAALEKLVDEAALGLRSGADMATLASSYIRNPAVRYNPPSWVAHGQLPIPLQQIIHPLKPGEVAAPLRNGNSVQLLQLMERRTAPRLAESTEYALKQLTIAVPQKRDKASLAKLRAAAVTLKSNPGDCLSQDVPMVSLPVKAEFLRMQLANLTPRQRSIVSHLEIGEVSEPLMGDDALRLVMLCEKIEPSTGALPDAEKIRQQLFAEKMELEAQKLLRNLRRDAYIDVKGSGE